MSNNVYYNLGGYILPPPGPLQNFRRKELNCSCRMDPFSQLKDWKEHVIKEHPIEGLKVRAFFCGENAHRRTISIAQHRFIQHMNKSHPAMHIDQCDKVWQWTNDAWQACNNNESESEIEIFNEAAKTPCLKLRGPDQQPAADKQVIVKKISDNSHLSCVCRLNPYTKTDAWIGHVATKHATEGMTLKRYLCESHGNKIFLQRNAFYSHITEFHPSESTDAFHAVVTFEQGKWGKAEENAKLSDLEFLKHAASIPAKKTYN